MLHTSLRYFDILLDKIYITTNVLWQKTAKAPPHTCMLCVQCIIQLLRGKQAVNLSLLNVLNKDVTEQFSKTFRMHNTFRTVTDFLKRSFLLKIGANAESKHINARS